jgi:hypothetical protein
VPENDHVALQVKDLEAAGYNADTPFNKCTFPELANRGLQMATTPVEPPLGRQMREELALLPPVAEQLRLPIPAPTLAPNAKVSRSLSEQSAVGPG